MTESQTPLLDDVYGRGQTLPVNKIGKLKIFIAMHIFISCIFLLISTNSYSQMVMEGRSYYVTKQIEDEDKSNKEEKIFKIKSKSKKTDESRAVFAIKAVGGDTLVVRDGDMTKIIRLYGIDAPDEGQRGHKSSELYLKTLAVDGKSPVILNVVGAVSDKYGRPHAIAYRDGVCINSAMISSGSALIDNSICMESECSEWKELEDNARETRIGMWSIPGDFDPPWIFRKKNARSFKNKDSGYIEGVYYDTKDGEVVASVPEYPRERFFIYPKPLILINRQGTQINVNTTNQNINVNKVGERQ